jgi:hypothetical protein
VFGETPNTATGTVCFGAVETVNLKRAFGTTKHTKDTKKEGLAAPPSFTQWESSAAGRTVSVFVCFVFFVVRIAGIGLT